MRGKGGGLRGALFARLDGFSSPDSITHAVLSQHADLSGPGKPSLVTAEPPMHALEVQGHSGAYSMAI